MNDSWMRCLGLLACLSMGLALVRPMVASAGCGDLSCRAECGLYAKDCQNAAKLDAQRQLLDCASWEGLDCAELQYRGVTECAGRCGTDLRECKATGKAEVAECKGSLAECQSEAKRRLKNELAWCADEKKDCLEGCAP